MHVYAIEQPSGLVKIGRSVQPSLRVNQIAREAGVLMRRMWFSMPTTKSIAAEIDAHKLLDGSRVYGEWFEIDFDAAVETIAEAIDAARQPQEKEPREWCSRFKAARKASKLTQDDISKAAGVSRVAVSHWESGTTYQCDAAAMLKACRTLGVSPYYVMLGEQATDSKSEADAILSTLTQPQRAQALRMLEAFAASIRASN